MPRRNSGPRSSSRRPAPAPPPARGGWVRQEAGADGTAWVVRSVSGSAATKPYRCPGCSQEIVPGTPHVVAWLADEADGIGREGSQERRHWHTGCWRRGRPGA